LAGMAGQHVMWVLFQAQQNALCHALHSIEARFCRWILQASEELDSATLDMTQECCSHILGVQRTSVSMIAHALQATGGMRTRRAKIEILARAELEQVACECYAKLQQHARRQVLVKALRP